MFLNDGPIVEGNKSYVTIHHHTSILKYIYHYTICHVTSRFFGGWTVEFGTSSLAGPNQSAPSSLHTVRSAQRPASSSGAKAIILQ